eukprot:Awhi_evm1s908
MGRFEFIENGEFQCVLCLSVPVNASGVSCCEGLYCHTCIETQIKRNKKCCTCRKNLSKSDVQLDFRAQRQIQNLLARCSDCYLKGSMNELKRKHGDIECVPRKRVMYPFDDMRVGKIVKVLDTRANWAFILNENDDTVSRFPLQKLGPVTPPKDPIFNWKDLDSLLTKEIDDPRLQRCLKQELNGELDKMILTFRKDKNDLFLQDRKEARKDNVPAFVQKVMKSCPDDKLLQFKSVSVLRYLFQESKHEVEMLLPLKIHLDIQKVMQCSGKNAQLLLICLRCLQLLFHNVHFCDLSIQSGIHIDIQNAMKSSDDHKLQSECCLAIKNLGSNSAQSLKVRNIHFHDDILRVMKRFPQDRNVQLQSMGALQQSIKDGPCDEFYLQNVHLHIQSAMQFFKKDKVVLLAALKCLKVIFLNKLYCNVSIQSGILSDIRNVMQTFKEDKKIQEECCLAIVKLSNSDTRRGELLDTTLPLDIHSAMKRFSQDVKVQYASIIALRTLINDEATDRTFCASNIFVDIQKAMLRFSEDRGLLLGAIILLQALFLNRLYCDCGAQYEIHSDIQRVMKLFRDDKEIQMNCCKAVINLSEELPQSQFLKLFEINFHDDIRAAMIRFPQDRDVQLQGLDALRIFIQNEPPDKLFLHLQTPVDIETAMQSFSKDRQLVEEASFCIKKLFEKQGHRPERIVPVISSGILNVMNSFENEEDIQVYCCAALKSLSMDEPWKSNLLSIKVHLTIQA